jgi:hypothetical protein
MRRVRVCLYGGTDLQGMTPEWMSEIAYEVLRRMDAVVVTGGFRHRRDRPGAVSTDTAALIGARRYCTEFAAELASRYEAWVPDPGLDRRPDVGEAMRMSEDDGITVRVVHGKTPLGRRLAMVRSVDAVVTIAGRRHTDVVGEQALDLGIPFLPIPVAEGDSAELLTNYRHRIAESFGAQALDRFLETVGGADVSPTAAARAVVDLLEGARIGRCLVLLPFDDEHHRRYESTIEPAVARHMIPVRLDRAAASGVIFGHFADAVDTASAVIADITDLNANVMYEVGFLHGRDQEPLLFTSDEAQREALPVYLSMRNVPLAVDDRQLTRLIDEYLGTIRAARGATALRSDRSR